MRSIETPDALVVCKARHARAHSLGREVLAWLADRGLDARLCEAGAESASAESAVTARPSRCVIVLGGDGTILGVARRFAFSGVPLFGINFGRVGFLTNADPGNWRERLKAALAPETPGRSCLVLRWRIFRSGRSLTEGVAINDVVVGRGALARLMGIHVTLDGCDMGILRCDGLLCCTPVGSSGYSDSAGGPILHPGMNVVGLTPICPYPGSASPLVLPGGAVCRLGVSAPAEAWLTVDGQEGQMLQGGDEVVVSGVPDGVRFLGEARFFERLRVRGFALDAEEGGEGRPDCRADAPLVPGARGARREGE